MSHLLPFIAFLIPVLILVWIGFREKKKFEETACACYHAPSRHFHRTGFCYSCRCQVYEQRPLHREAKP
jgi:hypothetical protein